MHTTYEEEDDDFPNEEVDYRRRARRPAGSVPDRGADNAFDLPLLTHAGTSKSNTVTYLKITRLDGPPGVRGFKGDAQPDMTHLGLAHRYGNGVYKIEGMSASHKKLATEEVVEISVPGFGGDRARDSGPEQRGDATAALGGHGMKLVSEMSAEHHRAIREQAKSTNDAVREMHNKGLEMLTAFTAAQREAEREASAAARENQQNFFASMMSMQTAAHQQQMQMLTASHERAQAPATAPDPMQMLEVFMQGMMLFSQMGGNGGGEAPAEWIQALKEGSGMLGSLAAIANSPAAQARTGAAALPAVPGARALPSASSAPAQGRSPAGPAGAQRRRRRPPFERSEIAALARLRAAVRARGLDLMDVLEQNEEHFRTAPESAIFAGDDGPAGTEDGSADAAQSDSTEAESTPGEASAPAGNT